MNEPEKENKVCPLSTRLLCDQVTQWSPQAGSCHVEPVAATVVASPPARGLSTVQTRLSPNRISVQRNLIAGLVVKAGALRTINFAFSIISQSLGLKQGWFVGPCWFYLAKRGNRARGRGKGSLTAPKPGPSQKPESLGHSGPWRVGEASVQQAQHSPAAGPAVLGMGIRPALRGALAVTRSMMRKLRHTEGSWWVTRRVGGR